MNLMAPRDLACKMVLRAQAPMLGVGFIALEPSKKKKGQKRVLFGPILIKDHHFWGHCAWRGAVPVRLGDSPTNGTGFVGRKFGKGGVTFSKSV